MRFLGYLYVREIYYKDLILWTCMEKKHGVHRECRGNAQTYEKDDGKHYLKQAKAHNHPPNIIRLEICHLMNRLKERAINETEIRCSKIFDEETANYSPDILENLPLRPSVIKTLNNHRRRLFGSEITKLETSKTEDGSPYVSSTSSKILSLKRPRSDFINISDDHIHHPLIELGSEVDVNVNHKGATKLNLKGFLLVRKSRKGDIIYWVCQRKVRGKCRGNAITIEKDGKHFLKSTRPHNHVACDEEPPEITEIMIKMKERARQTDESVAEIFDDTVKNLPDEIRSKLPIKTTAKRALKRFRMKYGPIDIGAIEHKKTHPPDVGLNSSDDHIHEPFVEPGSEVDVSVNHKGATKLNLNSFLLVRKSRTADVIYWVCQRKISGKCRGNAITIEKDGKHFLKSTRPHNHIACDEDPPEVTEIMLKMKERARQTDESLAKIYNDTVKDLPNEIRSKLPKKELAKRALKHFRMKYRPIDIGAIEPKKTHPPEVEEVLKRMKDRISITMETPSKVYNDEITWVPPHVLNLMPKREKILKSLKDRKRTVQNRRPKDEYEIPLVDIKL